MFNLATEFYNWCRYPSLTVADNPNVVPDLELELRLFAAGLMIPAIPQISDFTPPVFRGNRRFGNESWAEKRALSQDACDAISNFLQWTAGAALEVDPGDLGKIGGYVVILRKLQERQIVTYRRIEPNRDMRVQGRTYGMFVTVEMDSQTFTPP